MRLMMVIIVLGAAWAADVAVALIWSAARHDWGMIGFNIALTGLLCVLSMAVVLIAQSDRLQAGILGAALATLRPGDGQLRLVRAPAAEEEAALSAQRSEVVDLLEKARLAAAAGEDR